jgi:hypothetical protein
VARCETRPIRERSPAFELARLREGALSWPLLSARSSVATAGDVAAASPMEQSVDVCGGLSQLVRSGHQIRGPVGSRSQRQSMLPSCLWRDAGARAARVIQLLRCTQQVAADALGLAPEKVTVRVGDTRLPESHPAIGSSTMATARGESRRPPRTREPAAVAGGQVTVTPLPQRSLRSGGTSHLMAMGTAPHNDWCRNRQREVAT